MKVGLLGPQHLEVRNSFDKRTSMLNPAVVNLGNLLFRAAVASHLGEAEWTDGSIAPEEARNRFDILVMPLANVLSPWAGEDWGRWAASTADFLEATGLPVMALGVGAQARLEDTPRLTLIPEIVRLAKVIAEHSVAIGVRGEFTAEVLQGMGISNGVIIGCPSNFISRSGNLGREVQAKQEARVPGRMVFSGRDFDFKSMPLHRRAQTLLLDQAELWRGFYVIQAEESAIRLTRRDGRDQESDAYRSRLREYLRPWHSDDEFRRLIDQRFLSFPDLPGWLEFLSTADLHVGMRIHGSIAATQAGTPSLTIAHDMRTRELCETLGLPVLSVEEFCSTGLPQAVEGHPFDGDLYDSKRRLLADSYVKIFEDNGLTCHLPFT